MGAFEAQVSRGLGPGSMGQTQWKHLKLEKMLDNRENAWTRIWIIALVVSVDNASTMSATSSRPAYMQNTFGDNFVDLFDPTQALVQEGPGRD